MVKTRVKPAAKPAPVDPDHLPQFEVRLHRVVEQFASMVVSAHSADEAEAQVTGQLESGGLKDILPSLTWEDGEVEAGESVADVNQL